MKNSITYLFFAVLFLTSCKEEPLQIFTGHNSSVNAVEIPEANSLLNNRKVPIQNFYVSDYTDFSGRLGKIFFDTLIEFRTIFCSYFGIYFIGIIKPIMHLA